VVAGNIGNPFCGELGRITPQTVVVLEVSSFQLESSLSFHPDVACLLNLTTNHLDRHKSLKAYRTAKARLFAHQGRRSGACLNADDEGSASFALEAAGAVVWFSRRRKVTGAHLADGWLTLNLPNLSGPICRRESLARRGPHHEENALAASCLAGLLGVAPEISGQVIQHFQGLAHRQEVVAVLRGVTFVNDSKATTVSAGIRAIEAAPSRVVLIAGGRDKGSDFSTLRTLRGKIKAVVAIGEDGPKISRALKGFVPSQRSDSLRGAVQAAFGMAREGEWVLLSPMCTSFDMFRDFEDRGAHFVKAVAELSNGCVP
jgi:UDP-N-acetylmuramoylalanine--D-glutamate ligase